MKVTSLMDIQSEPIFYYLNDIKINLSCYLKIEHLNIAGSIKLKSALRMVNELEKNGSLKPHHSVVICSSSGNLGIALCIICKERGYPFICVSDPNISSISEKYIVLLGGKLIKVEKRDHNGGYLATRINLINEMLMQHSNYVFVNQYEDEENAYAHYLTTGYEIMKEFKHVDYLFIGAGTTGTLMGCAKFFKQFSPKTKVIAVDSIGSVTFDKPPGKRHIAGLGTSSKPKLVKPEYIDEVVMVNEIDTLWICHYLLQKKGLFLGGSTGTVLQGIRQHCKNISNNSVVVTISPDAGDRYLNSVYDQEWIINKFGSLPIID